MRDGSHNLECRLEGFEYKPVSKSGSRLKIEKNGKVIHDGAFRSFTSNFMKLLYGNMIGSGTVTVTDLNGDASAIDDYPNVKMNFADGSTIQKFGIGVGSSATAVASDDNDLTWVSALTYGAVVVGAPAVDGTTVKVDITREISNTSGSTKALYESGLIIGSEDESDENILIARDTLAVTLLNNEKATWTYSIVVDFDSTTGGFVKNFLDSFIIANWIQATASANWDTRYGHTSVVFDDKMWIIGGYAANYANDVWYSTDGETWTQATATAPFTARQAHTSVVFDNKMWVIGGDTGSASNDVYYSTDGATWTLCAKTAPFTARSAHTSVVFDDKMWIIGGDDGSVDNDVWYSTDGATWTLCAKTDPFTSRSDHTSVVFDSKMWIIGGFTSAVSNDVYYSTDGETWTLCAKTASFSARRYHASIVSSDKMWVMSGYDGSTRNDIYYSTDGATWIQVDASTDWTARSYLESVVFNDKMWIMGGYDTGQLNDVWEYGQQLKSTEEISVDTYGIIVGTSDGAFSGTGTALTAKISHGTGAGEIKYGVCPNTGVSSEPATVGSTTSMKIARSFENISGSSITIKEVGIQSVNGLLCRFVPTTPIVIANGASEVVSIVFESEV